jgi:pimeloyl-ACP methyl ester carboxylesterase
MTLTPTSCTTPDGRQIEFATIGNPANPTVVYHHGTPGSVFLLDGFAEQAEKYGLFIVGMSRAGYGKSTAHTGRSVADVVADVRTVLSHLGRTEYATVGWSGGGPHALACAALDPNCLHAVSLAGVAPVVDDFDWTEGMGPENIEEFALAKEGGPAYDEAIQHATDAFCAATAGNVIDLFGGLLSEVDKSSMAPLEARELIADALAYGLSAGPGGFRDDDQAFLRDWGFTLDAITTPVTIFFGDHDLMVPPRHGHYLTATIPTAQSRHLPAEGHISLVLDHGDEIFGVIAGVFA